MPKAELRFIDDEYCVTYGNLRVRVDDLIENRETTMRMPDGSEQIIEDVSRMTIFKAACFLNDFHLEDNNEQS